MPKLSEQTQQARRERILDAAERCFVQRGFHRTSMQDICREAGISPGALYIYFASKEDLIAGICERETLQFAEHLELMSEAPDFMTALRTLADTYCVGQPRSKLQLHIEIGAEMIRNEKVSARVLEVDRFVQERFTLLIERLRREGRIAPSVDSAVAARVLLMMGDGLFWNRALYPDFDPQTLVPAMMTMIETLINPVKAETPAKPAPARKKAMKKSKAMALLAAIIAAQWRRAWQRAAVRSQSRRSRSRRRLSSVSPKHGAPRLPKPSWSLARSPPARRCWSHPKWMACGSRKSSPSRAIW